MMHWLLEKEMFGVRADMMAEAAEGAGHRVSAWDDDWWDNGRFPVEPGEIVLFHGSLENASRVRAKGWNPGSYCDVEAFTCSNWYPKASDYLLQRDVIFSTVRNFCEAPRETILNGLDPLDPRAPKHVFVRPDSPLKPFSGRVVDVHNVTPEVLDYGFYYEDMDLPIVISSQQFVGHEWRFVVVDGRVVAGSEYLPEGRQAAGRVDGSVQEYTEELVGLLESPEDVYVLDVCESAGTLRLLELNPFSGADLYGCDPHAVVNAISSHLEAV